MKMQAPATLFYGLGGAVGIRQIVDDFYRRMLEDDALSPDFDGADLRQLRRRQYEVLAAAMGGVSGELVHLPTAVTVGLTAGDAHFDRALAHLVDTLEAFGTEPAVTEELLAILTSLHPAIATA